MMQIHRSAVTGLLLLTLFLFLAVTIAQIHHSNEENPCLLSDSCSACISASAKCAWCVQANFTGKRCDYSFNLDQRGCNPYSISAPIPEFNLTKDDSLSDTRTRETDATQLKPQRVHLKVRPHVPYRFPAQFKQAVDYPVDLYYLMDLSKSMLDDKEKLASLGDLLASEMQRITSNFRLGFGSFVDKVVMPYVSILPEKLEHPCQGCVKPYGFINHMPLDTDTSQFKTQVNQTQISGNLDAPEGGFDAIMQSIVCLEDIKWRKYSRKLLVFSTDSSFHYAGDGKLGGIVKPNDGHCHLQNGLYTESSSQDYPSVSQIHKKVKEYDVNLIFAVTKEHFHVYEQLANIIESATAGKLLNDSSNIVTLVKEEYQKITSAVILKDNATEDVTISYYSRCLGGEKLKTATCKGLRVGTVVDYEIEIEVQKCPQRLSERNQTIIIKPKGLSDQLIVDLEIVCDCECEKPWVEEPFSERCNSHGTYECGICACDQDWFGEKCTCNITGTDPNKQEKSCYLPNQSKPCSGRGACVCGECKCDDRKHPERIWGDFCECDNFGCERNDGLLCSGNGRCDCYECICDAGWTGSACQCKTSNESCIQPGTDQICSGKGDCVCGECVCSEDKEGNRTNLYIGQYCQHCPTCENQCKKYTPCVQCQMWKTGPYDEEKCALCPFLVTDVENFEVNDNEVHCFFQDDDKCNAQFKYQPYGDGGVYVEAKREKDCPIGVSVFAIVVGLILFIVLLGLLLLLLWKLYTVIHDRREFAKFEKERQMAKWDTGENPIYKQATSTFKNPLYGGK